MKTRCVASVESEDILLLSERRVAGVRSSRCDSDSKGDVTDNLSPVRSQVILFWGKRSQAAACPPPRKVAGIGYPKHG